MIASRLLARSWTWASSAILRAVRSSRAIGRDDERRDLDRLLALPLSVFFGDQAPIFLAVFFFALAALDFLALEPPSRFFSRTFFDLICFGMSRR